MSITPRQRHNLRESIQAGLRRTLCIPEPMTAAEWADQYFYLSAESSYGHTVGRWTTIAYQLAILNSMGNDDIRQVGIMKSARLGYTKMLLAFIGYQVEHKRRNSIIWQPTDKDADEFTKEHVEPMIRDVPCVRGLFPWFGKKHRYNTLGYKLFSNSRQLHIRGGKSPKNYREKSADNAIYDELSSFDLDVGDEGNAVSLGDKRIDGAAFPKSIRGSTPKNTGQCEIETALQEADETFYRYVPCPHCGHEQVLRWGGKDADFGIKWEGDDKTKSPKTAYYLCEENACVIENKHLREMDDAGYWKSGNGVTTVDGITFYGPDGKQIDAPESVGFQIWQAYSPFTTWAKIVRQWFEAKKKRSKLKAFINTVLGETFDERPKALDSELLLLRRENYVAQVPRRALVLTAGVDVQDDRLELSIWGYGGEEWQDSWLIEHDIYRGDPGRALVWSKLGEHLRRAYEHASGVRLRIAAAAIDSGGHHTQQVYKFAAKYRRRNVFAIKGSNQANAPLAGRPTKQAIKGGKQTVLLYPVGSSTAKDEIYSLLSVTNRQESGYVHFPLGSTYIDEEYFKQLASHERKGAIRNGQRVVIWVQNRNRDEAADCFAYSRAALEILRPNYRAIVRLFPKDDEESDETQPESGEKGPNPRRPVRKKRKKVRKKRRNFARDW